MVALSQSAIIVTLLAICVVWVWRETDAAVASDKESNKPVVTDLEKLMLFSGRNYPQNTRQKRSVRDSDEDSASWLTHVVRAARRHLSGGVCCHGSRNGQQSDESRRGDSSSSDSDESRERRISPGDGQWYTDRHTYRYRYRVADGDRDGLSRGAQAPNDGYYGYRQTDRGWYGGRGYSGGRSRGGYSGGRSRGGYSGGRSRGRHSGGRSRGGRSHHHGGRSHGRHSGGRSRGRHYGGRSRGRHSGGRSQYSRDSSEYGRRYGDSYGTRYSYSQRYEG